MVQIKRIYDAPAESDGYRVLVDRLWPRGVAKERAAIDSWMKDVAPSPELRIWFGHDPAKFAEFREHYQTELAQNPAVAELRKLAKNNKTVTLLYGAKDPKINHATVLLDFLS